MNSPIKEEKSQLVTKSLNISQPSASEVPSKRSELKLTDLNAKKVEELTAGFNPKELRFCHYYIELGNQVQAAKKAGYSEHSAYSSANRLFKRHKIITYIDYLKRELLAKNGVDAPFIRNIWLEVVNDRSNSTSDRLRASEFLAKEAGLFKENTTNVAIFQNLSKEDLAIIKAD